jgi:hypothetical protein
MQSLVDYDDSSEGSDAEGTTLPQPKEDSEGNTEIAGRKRGREGSGVDPAMEQRVDLVHTLPLAVKTRPGHGRFAAHALFARRPTSDPLDRTDNTDSTVASIPHGEEEPPEASGVSPLPAAPHWPAGVPVPASAGWSMAAQRDLAKYAGAGIAEGAAPYHHYESAGGHYGAGWGDDAAADGSGDGGLSSNGMVSISGAALRGAYVPPPPRESSSGKAAAVQTKVWNAAQGAVITSREPSRLAKRKHQIGSLAAQAIAKAADNLDHRSHGLKTKAQTRSEILLLVLFFPPSSASTQD